MALPCHWMILDISTDGTLQLTKPKITTKCCSSVWPSSISSSSSKSSKPTCSILRSFRKPLFILSLETTHPRENSKDLKSNWTISFKFQANACMSNHNEPYLVGQAITGRWETVECSMHMNLHKRTLHEWWGQNRSRCLLTYQPSGFISQGKVAKNQIEAGHKIQMLGPMHEQILIWIDGIRKLMHLEESVSNISHDLETDCLSRVTCRVNMVQGEHDKHAHNPNTNIFSWNMLKLKYLKWQMLRVPIFIHCRWIQIETIETVCFSKQILQFHKEGPNYVACTLFGIWSKAILYILIAAVHFSCLK